MPNQLFHIRIPPEGIKLLREARVQALRSKMTLGQWLTAVLRDKFSDREKV